ncbi:MAG: peptidoglycan DD-metalloendopeptidase family protein [Pseudomonadota bacterium]
MTFRKTLMIGVSAMALGACDGPGLASLSDSLDRRPSAQPLAQTAPRPKPDSRGLITYPNYQVIVARSGDTMDEVAARIGMGGAELARFNGLPGTYRPRSGEVLALPKGVVIPQEGAGQGATTASLESIASTAIGRAGNGAGQTPAKPVSRVQEGPEPIRHVVEQGETAYSIARLYSVSVNALSNWNGLGKDLSVRPGQRLLIPVIEDGTPAQDVAALDTAPSQPGSGSVTPLPPSSVAPLPDPEEAAASQTDAVPESPDLVEERTARSNLPQLQRPVSGKVLRGYSSKPGGNEGLDFAAAKGTSVKAADDGTVALVSSAAGNSKIVLIRHPDNFYTVYSNVSDVPIAKGDRVARGQTVGKVAGGSPAYVHFEIRKGTQSVDPTPYF